MTSAKSCSDLRILIDWQIMSGNLFDLKQKLFLVAMTVAPDYVGMGYTNVLNIIMIHALDILHFDR